MGATKQAWTQSYLEVSGSKSFSLPWCNHSFAVKLHYTSQYLYCNLFGHLLLVLVFTREIYGSWCISVLEAAFNSAALLHKPPQKHIPAACIAEHLVYILHSMYFNSFNLKDYFQSYFTYFTYDHKFSSAFSNRMSSQYGICFLIGITVLHWSGIYFRDICLLSVL